MQGEQTSTTGGGYDGYFATASPAAPSWQQQGYGPLPTQPAGGASPPSVPAPAAGASLPPLVVVVATVLVLTGVAALWTGLTMLVGLNAVGSPPEGHFGLKAALLLLNGGANLYLARQVLAGWAPARLAVSAVCGGWLLWWLYETSQASDVFGKISSSPFGGGGVSQVGIMVELGLLLLAGLAAGTAALLWTASGTRHFGR